MDLAYAAAVEAGANPRIMLVNSPSNPTGQVFGTEQVARIVEFCEKKAITLISDEIYSDICFEEADVGISAFGRMGAIMTGGLSKVLRFL